MSKSNICRSVSLAALACGLGAMPAHASDLTFDLASPAADSVDNTGPSISRDEVARLAIEDYRLPPVDTFRRKLDPELLKPIEDKQSLRLDQAILTRHLRNDQVYNFDGLDFDVRPQLVIRDDQYDNAIDSGDTQPSVVQLFRRDNTTDPYTLYYNCTGTLINPRTVLTAAHCVNDFSSEEYGLPESSNQTLLNGTGFNSAPRINSYRSAGLTHAEGGAAQSSDVIVPYASNLGEGELSFPHADIALIALDEPITDIPWMPILLSPLDHLANVVQVGFGTHGTGSDGELGFDTLRRVGENTLGAIGSIADFFDAAFPMDNTARQRGLDTQTLYWTDFDNPDRTQNGADLCEFQFIAWVRVDCGGDVDTIQAIDWFDGDALDQEAATAPGDSGSPLIAEGLYDQGLVTAVLGGGYAFPGLGAAPSNGYGDVSHYNPLYPFFEFISENTPYKYVSAQAGGRWFWSDPNAWTQDLDPGFIIRDEHGAYVNGLPEGSQTGVYDTGNKLGTILGTDISDYSTDVSAGLPAEGTFGFGANIPESSALLGPGSTGFVPNNTDGTPGESHADPAQYFDARLNRATRLVADIDVTIDKLTIEHPDVRFVIGSDVTFETEIGFDQLDGNVRVLGDLKAPTINLYGGEFRASKSIISTNTFKNIGGTLLLNTANRIGYADIVGDFVQGSGGTYVAKVSARGRPDADHLWIWGNASLAGTLEVVALDRRFFAGLEVALINVLGGGEITGNFEYVNQTGPYASAVLYPEVQIEDSDTLKIVYQAHRIRSLVGARSKLGSLGGALDTLRLSGRSGAYNQLFSIVDRAGWDTLGATLASLTPQSAFTQTFTANAFARRFGGQLSQRTLSLRDGHHTAGVFSPAGNDAFSIAGTSAQETGQLGFFGSVSGVYLDQSNGEGLSDINSNTLLLNEAGEITLGTDMRLSDGLSVGVAFSDIRNDSMSLSSNWLRPDQDRSRAVAAYATYQAGRSFADGYVGVADQTYGVERSSQGDFTSRFNTAIGSSEGRQTFAGLRLGHSFDLAKGLELGPAISFNYAYNSLGAYTEYGAGNFGLSVDARQMTSLSAKAGAMATLDLPLSLTGRNSLSAFLSAAYARELADHEDVVTAHFLGAADVPFTLANALDPEWVSVHAGAELDLNASLKAGFSVTSDIGRGVLSNDQGQVTVRWLF